MDREQKHPFWHCSASLSHEGRLLRKHVEGTSFDAPGSSGEDIEEQTPDGTSREQMRKWIFQADQKLKSGEYDQESLRSLVIDALLNNEGSEVVIDAREAQNLRRNVQDVLIEAGLDTTDLQALQRDFPTDTESILDLWEEAGLITKIEIGEAYAKAGRRESMDSDDKTAASPDQMDLATLRKNLFDARQRMFHYVKGRRTYGYGKDEVSKAVQGYIALNTVYEQKTGHKFAKYLMDEGLPLYSDGSTKDEMQARAEAMDADYKAKHGGKIEHEDKKRLLADPDLRRHWGSPMQGEIMRRRRWQREWKEEGIPLRSEEMSPTQLISGLGLRGGEIPGQEGVYDSTDYHRWEHSAKHREGMHGIGPGAYGPWQPRERRTNEIPETQKGAAKSLGAFDSYAGYRFRPYGTESEMREYRHTQHRLRYENQTKNMEKHKERFKALEKHYRNHPQYGHWYRELDALLKRKDTDPYAMRTKLMEQVAALEMGQIFENEMESLRQKLGKTKTEFFGIPKAASTMWRNLTVKIVNTAEPTKIMKYLPGVAERVGDDNTLEWLINNGIHVENAYNRFAWPGRDLRINGVNVQFSKPGTYRVVVNAEGYRREYEVGVSEQDVGPLRED